MKMTREDVRHAHKEWLRLHNSGAKTNEVDAAFVRFAEMDLYLATDGGEFVDFGRSGKRRK